ncbi:MAG: hypothetical protein RL685_7694 [Pseudomonadota bacterium]|jgi:hypothetical protein
MGKPKEAGGGRGRLSATQGRALVEQWRRSGLSVSEYCRARGVGEHVLRYRLSREATPSKSVAPQGEFFVVSAPTMAPGVAHASDGNRAGGAVIVMLPAVTPAELVQTVRGLLEGRA